VGTLERQLNRVDHDVYRFFGWALIAGAAVWLVAEGFGTWEPAAPAAVGIGVLLWMRRFGPFGTEHVVTIEYLDFEGPPFYQACCDCGWEGPRRQFGGPAREDGRGHAPDVLTAVEDYR
jgi:hypothetical protein